jgi:peptidoglycan hydrolase-like protein with peptidoglycan-binding domain
VLRSGRAASAEDPKATNLLLMHPCASGDRVTALQEALKSRGIALDVDGTFGAQTDAAVRLFQSHHDLMIDGIVGPATRALLGL